MPVEITLRKSEYNIPWGFGLHGGKDFGAPITVQRIKPESIASKSGLREGDNISVINGETTNGLKHLEAQDLIKKGRVHLNLTICRGEEIVVRHIKDDVDDHSYEANFKVETETPQANLTTSNNPSSYKPSLGASPFKPSLGAPPFKASSNITSNNASLYKPSMQTITSGLTKLQTEDDFPPPPPPPQSFSPHYLTPMQNLPEVSVTTIEGDDKDANKYTHSETYKLVKDIDSGAEIPFSPKTGAGMKSLPIQSRLMGILEKKHGQIQYEKQQDDVGKGPHKTYTVPKSPLTVQDNRSPNMRNSPSNNQSSSLPFNRASPSQFQPHKSPQHSPQPARHQPFIPPQQPSQPPLNQSRKLLDSLDKGGAPICNVCNETVRGAYVLAINKIWCPDHFVCSNATCRKPLSSTGFIEEGGKLYCKEDYEKYLAPKCTKCSKPIVGNTVKALQGSYHPECFLCHNCSQPIAGGVFHLHEGDVYCDKDFSSLFSTKCLGCNFPIEAGENWIEASGTNWHGECFNCSVCHTNLQTVGFIHRNGRFLCKDHARTA